MINITEFIRLYGVDILDLERLANIIPIININKIQIYVYIYLPLFLSEASIIESTKLIIKSSILSSVKINSLASLTVLILKLFKMLI